MSISIRLGELLESTCDTDTIEAVRDAIMEINALRAEIARLRLTDEERQCLEEAIYRVAEHDNEPDGWKSYAADTLRGLLERLGGDR